MSVVRGFSDMSTETRVFPLLKLPAGVESHLLSFVASGKAGLQSLLSLRQVCSTTKSWVDRLPDQQGKSLFSRSQVKMNSDVRTIQRFLKSPPPFKVSSLSLNFEKVVAKNPPAEDEKLWTCFCALWAPKLETLELRKRNEGGRYEVVEMSPRILRLLESPNLRCLRMNPIWVTLEISETRFPSSIYKVSELGIKMSFTFKDLSKREVNEKAAQFYSELTKNPNLRILETCVFDSNKLGQLEDHEGLEEFIDFKKNDSQLQMNIHLMDTILCGAYDEIQADDEVHLRNNEVYLKFATSVVSSKSKIRLQMYKEENFEYAYKFLPRNVGVEMFGKVESVEILFADVDEMSLAVDLLLRLKEATFCTECLFEGDEEQVADKVTLPPSLEELRISTGFLSIGILPATLSSLTLMHVSSDVGELLNWLTLLKTQCCRLETLDIQWTSIRLKEPYENIKKSPEFSSLRSLTFYHYKSKPNFANSQNKDSDRDFLRVLRNGIQVESLKLHHLALRFMLEVGQQSSGDCLSPVLDVPFLARLCEGPVGNSLLSCDIAKGCVNPGGLPLLQKLESMAAANVKRQWQ